MLFMCSNAGCLGFVGVLQWFNLTGENMNNEGLTLNQLAERNAVLVTEAEKLRSELEQLAAENVELKSSRAILAENALESCNSIACAGFRHEAIMRGLYASTGNGNKYPKPITTLVDEEMRKLETPATDRIVAEAEARGVEKLAMRRRAAAKVALDEFNDVKNHAELESRCMKKKATAGEMAKYALITVLFGFLATIGGICAYGLFMAFQVLIN